MSRTQRLNRLARGASARYGTAIPAIGGVRLLEAAEVRIVLNRARFRAARMLEREFKFKVSKRSMDAVETVAFQYLLAVGAVAPPVVVASAFEQMLRDAAAVYLAETPQIAEGFPAIGAEWTRVEKTGVDVWTHYEKGWHPQDPEDDLYVAVASGLSETPVYQEIGALWYCNLVKLRRLVPDTSLYEGWNYERWQSPTEPNAPPFPRVLVKGRTYEIYALTPGTRTAGVRTAPEFGSLDRRPPPEPVREGKWAIGFRLVFLLNLLTEAIDIVEAAYYALPPSMRQGVSNPPVHVMVQTILQSWHHVDQEQFAENLATALFFDAFIGMLTRDHSLMRRISDPEGFHGFVTQLIEGGYLDIGGVRHGGPPRV